jgi:hypothetical protein
MGGGGGAFLYCDVEVAVRRLKTLTNFYIQVFKLWLLLFILRCRDAWYDTLR